MTALRSQLLLTVDPSSGSYLQAGSATSFKLEVNQVPAVVGRDAQADIRLLAPFISRRHAIIGHDGANWMIRDAGSKVGTQVNESAGSEGSVWNLQPGDRIHLGPLVLNVAVQDGEDPAFNLLMASASSTFEKTTMVARDMGGSVAAISEQELSGLAQHRLTVLLRSAARLTEAADSEALAQALTRAAASGTGSPRAIWLGFAESGELIVLGHFPPRDTKQMELELSRSLVAMARKGQVAELQSDGLDHFGEAMSIETLNIRSAICAPIQVDSNVVGVLYLDTRGTEKPITSDAAAFCVALAQLGGMALANLNRAELARKEKEMRDELVAARFAQQQMIPESTGETGPIRYALVAVPGMIVAGDVFDIVPIDPNCTHVLLGDVMGKGAAAGIMMATVQTYFRARSHERIELGQLMAEANAYFHERFKGKGFVTLWMGRFQAPGKLNYIDGGHGHWCWFRTGSGIQEVESIGGPPVGAFPSSTYEVGELELEPGDRIIIYSDGLVEQHDDQGRLFEDVGGFDCLSQSGSTGDDVQLLVNAQNAFRGSVPLSDDLTIASIQLLDPRSASNG